MPCLWTRTEQPTLNEVASSWTVNAKSVAQRHGHAHEVRAPHVRTASQVGAGKGSGQRHGQAAVANLDLRRRAR